MIDAEKVLTRLIAVTATVGMLVACGPDGNEGDLAQADASDARAATIEPVTVTRSPGALYVDNCAVCHGRDGNGTIGPALAGNRNLTSSSYVVARIQLGGGGMPPFAPLLNSSEIAEVSTFIRNSWENAFGVVSAEQVDLQWHGYRLGNPYGVQDGETGQ